MERCCCGNVLRESRSRIRVSPCRCAKPAPGPRRFVGPTTLPDGSFGVTKRQYEQRTRLGLPPITEIERSFAREMNR